MRQTRLFAFVGAPNALDICASLVFAVLCVAVVSARAQGPGCDDDDSTECDDEDGFSNDDFASFRHADPVYLEEEFLDVHSPESWAHHDEPFPAPNLDDWLWENQEVAESMRWLEVWHLPAPTAHDMEGAPQYEWKQYNDWPQKLKDRLQLAFNLAWKGSDLAISYPPANLFDVEKDYIDPATGTTVPALLFHFSSKWQEKPGVLAKPDRLHITDDTAIDVEAITDIYLSNIAHTLEAIISAKVPWTFSGLTQDELELIFNGEKSYGDTVVITSNGSLDAVIEEWQLDGSNMIKIPHQEMQDLSPGILVTYTKTPSDESPHNYIPPPNYSLGLVLTKHVLPAPGSSIRAFLLQNGIIGNDQQNTLINLTMWTSENMHHYGISGINPSGSPHYEYPHRKEMSRVWGYAGLPPLTRTLFGYQNLNSRTAKLEHRHYACFGASSLAAEVLAAVGIPTVIHDQNHHRPFFPSIGLGLGHGDDLASWFTSADNVDLSVMFFSEQEFQQFFVGKSDATIDDNMDNKMKAAYFDHQPIDVAVYYTVKRDEVGEASAKTFFASWFGKTVAELDAAWNGTWWTSLYNKGVANGGVP